MAGSKGTKATGNAYKSSPRKQVKSSAKKENTSWHHSVAGFFTNRKVHMVFGLFLLLFSLYLMAAFTSFLHNWFTFNADDLTGVSFFRSLTDPEVIVHNVTGRLGAYLSYLFIKKWFGLGSYLFVLAFFIAGVRIFLRHQLIPWLSLTKHSLFWLLCLAVIPGFLFSNPAKDTSVLGGTFGAVSSEWLVGVLGRIGAGTFLFASLTAYFIWVFDLWDWLIHGFNRQREVLAEQIGRATRTGGAPFEGDKYNTQEYYVGDHDHDFQGTTVQDKTHEEDGAIPLFTDDEETHDPEMDEEPDDDGSDLADDIDFTVVRPSDEPEIFSGDELKEPDPGMNAAEREHYDLETLYNPKLDLRDYKFPPIELLDLHGSNTITVEKSELESNKNRIIQTLKNYQIDIDRIKATIGPTVTLYEIVPAPGVRISKIKNLEDDIALSLSALGIRIIAPIPGKGTIGIEVPNLNPEIVSMRTILSSEKFRQNKFELPIGLGKTIANETYVADLTKMPHLLIAGATGQGKSVGLNAIITSLLYTKHPAELKFVLVDPKKVELSLFSRIQRHFLAKLPDTDEAIITDNRIVVRTLNSLCIEMDNRYNMLKTGAVRNIGEYNSKFISRQLNPLEGHRFMPYIVLIVDEFADLIMTSGKEIEGPIARLAQLARAVGIHLVIATQRPSVNIITGTIKANFPARIAFRVTAKVDSRTILDSGGAEQLVGRGDMLLYTGSDLTRLQCAFLDIPEVEKITDYIGSQRGYSEAYELPDFRDENDDEPIDFDPGERDDLFEEAARLIVRHQHGSTSLIQRKMKLGYNRAGRLMDQLEAAGVVGAFEGSKAREVLFQDEYALEQYLKNYLNSNKNGKL
jgi:DNA segregation ATPase FtsK/SpoIIIE, S-DNA-T family